MKIDFAGIQADYLAHKDRIDSAIARVLASGNFILGEEVERLEDELKQYIFGSNEGYAITCSNGTSALYLALRALGIQAGDEVITTSFSFFASVEMILLVGATPVFIDIQKDDFNLDIKRIQDHITPRTKAILGVSLFGQACDLFELQKLAAENQIAFIEDGAQSFGAQIFHDHQWHQSLSLADISTTSFFPAKPLGCFGDGGALFCKSEKLAKHLKALRIHAQNKRYHHDEIGISSRLDSLQAAVLREKLAYYNEMIEKRNEVAKYYLKHLKHLTQITLPTIREDKKSVWAQFSILAHRRDGLQSFLKDKMIPTAVHYPIILPEQKALSHIEKKGDFPCALQTAQSILSLPINPYLKEEELHYITQSIEEFYAG